MARLSGVVLAWAASAAVLAPCEAARRKNLVYMIADDLRPQLGSFGQTVMSTPNLDALAAKGTTFMAAYAQVAVCCPSRSSFMTGRRPNVTHVFDNTGTDFRLDGIDGDEWATVPGHLKNSGWTTVGGGKSYHPGRPPNWDGDRSWNMSARAYFGFTYNLKDRNCPNAAKKVHVPGQPISGIDTWCPIDTPPSADNDLFYDATLVNYSLTTMEGMARRFHDGEGPFAMYVGFARPHVPHRVPKALFDHYYAIGDVPKNSSIPENFPPVAYHRQGLYNYSTFEEPVGGWFVPNFTQVLTHDQQRTARAAYFASVTWMDMQVGRLMERLDHLGIANDTVVVFHGDHGWELGESNMLHKETNLEIGTRVPLIIVDPDTPPAARGKRTLYLAELLDVGQTVFDLVGAPPPEMKPARAPPMGRSLRQAMENPDGPWPGQAGTAAFSQFPRCVRHDGNPVWMHDDIGGCSGSDTPIMGYTVRTPQWRHVRWMNWNRTSTLTDWTQPPVAMELYSHHGDDGTTIGAFERNNTAADPANAAVVQALGAQLRGMFDTPNH